MRLALAGHRGVEPVPHRSECSGPEVIRIGQALADVATIGLIQQRSPRQHDVLVDQLQTRRLTLLRGYARNHGHRLTEVTASLSGRPVPRTRGIYHPRVSTLHTRAKCLRNKPAATGEI